MKLKSRLFCFSPLCTHNYFSTICYKGYLSSIEFILLPLCQNSFGYVVCMYFGFGVLFHFINLYVYAFLNTTLSYYCYLNTE